MFVFGAVNRAKTMISPDMWTNEEDYYFFFLIDKFCIVGLICMFVFSHRTTCLVRQLYCLCGLPSSSRSVQGDNLKYFLVCNLLRFGLCVFLVSRQVVFLDVPLSTGTETQFARISVEPSHRME